MAGVGAAPLEEGGVESFDAISGGESTSVPRHRKRAYLRVVGTTVCSRVCLPRHVGLCSRSLFLLQFVFDSFDQDGSGALDEDEFMQVCTVVNNGAPTFPGNFGRALEEFDSNDDGMIDFDEVREQLVQCGCVGVCCPCVVRVRRNLTRR